MKRSSLVLLASGLLTARLIAADAATESVDRTWHDTQGRAIQATFRGIEGDNVFLQVANGYVHRIPLAKLTAEDQKMARTLKPAGLGIPLDPNLAQAAARIDTLVNGGLTKAGQQPNPLASDEQFIRRVYLDIAGRIPTKDETVAFLQDTSEKKRAKVIDQLLDSDGFSSHLFNYLADMLRVADVAQKARFYTYEDWLKDQVRKNVGWDKIVYAMMTADGHLLDNGATGYLLRDAGMRLDNLSLTLSTFLGANVACAQCHDHPFAEWTQRDFYQMASFFGASETYGVKGAKGGSQMEMRQVLRSIDDKRLQNAAKNIMRVNAMEIVDTGANDMKLPDDYKYSDGKPGDMVKPKLVTWKTEDTRLKSYQEAGNTIKKEEELRDTFAKWMTAPDNPRFAMTIANRMWKRAFGVAVREPVTDIDDVNAASNPPLLQHLAAEMVRLKFDMKQFMRLLFNTQAYQREATSYELADNAPYLFQGPILRRMTAEQAWDSCATLVVGNELDRYKANRGEKYAAAMKIDMSKPAQIEEQIRNAASAMRQYGGGKGNPKAGPAARKRMAMKQAQSGDDDTVESTPPMRDGLVLARASELPQPERDQHFLRQFGQSDRQIADSGSDEGSVPQVMMLMNGDAQRAIGSNESLVVQTAARAGSPEGAIESLYLSFLSRKPKPDELATAKESLNSGLTLKDLTWVLFNSREFIFVE